MPGFKWVKYTGERSCTPGMITVGVDHDGTQLVVARAQHNGETLPAKGKPEHGLAYIAYGGSEVVKKDFEILMPAEFRWISSGCGHVPFGAVEGGKTASGEVLFIGRARHHGAPVLGKIQPSHGTMYISYGGKEVPYEEYEVLVQH